MTPQSLYYGDCLDWMGQWPAESVDLIYLDPPFNSNANYNILFGEGNGVPAQVRAFKDTWKWDTAAVRRTQRITNAVAHPAHRALNGLQQLLGASGMLAYTSYMAERIPEMRRLLKPTGSIYLHCDPTASHYLKVLLDSIFVGGRFRNEIIWCYRGGGVPTRDFARKHDVILRYSKTAAVTFHRQRVPYSDASAALVASRGGVSIDNRPRDLDQGATMPDWWTDINSLQTWSPERIGYPTQKPVALLERIIRASSNEGDIVLDPFCGGGTTIVAAANLNRQWVGIDISPHAIDITQNERLTPMGIRANIEGIPLDMAGARRLAQDNPQDFEAWAVTRIAGLAPNEIKVGDGGIDGRGRMEGDPEPGGSKLVLAQVKGGRPAIDQVRAFLAAMSREGAAMGVFVTVDRFASPSARAETAALGEIRVGAESYPRAQLWSIAEYFERRPPRMPTMVDPHTGRAIQGRMG